MPLRNRGSLTICFTPERPKRSLVGRRNLEQRRAEMRHYLDFAIETALTLRTVFRFTLRQSEGLIESVMNIVLTDGRNGHAE